MNISLWSHTDCSLLWLLFHRSPQSCSLFPTSNAWEQHGINRVSVGVNMLSHLLSFFPLVFAPSEFFPLMAFQFSKLYIIPASDHYSCIPVLPQHCSNRGWRHTVRHPPGLTGLWWCGYNSLSALLQTQMTNEVYYILSKCFVHSVSYLIHLLAV